MGRFKLKVPKLTWQQKLIKLQRIVLAGAPLVEASREMLDLFEQMRMASRGQISDDESARATFDALWSSARASFDALMWEPYSDGKGDVEQIFGWDLQATLYCADGKPWWLARAANKLDKPSEKSFADIARTIDYFGADATRDCIMNIGFGGGGGYSLWWTWINQHQLLEMQARKSPPDMRVVPEGTPLPPGYERFERPKLNPRALARTAAHAAAPAPDDDVKRE